MLCLAWSAGPLVWLAMGPLSSVKRADLSQDGRGRDEALVARARRGDASAFEELYRSHVNLVWARLTRLIGPDPEREDLAQQAFLQAFRSLDRFRGEAAFSTFLHRIVTHVAIDHLRRVRSRPPLGNAEWLQALACEGRTPEEQTRDRHMLLALWRCLESIKPAKRAAYVLRVIEGLPLEEVAQLTGTTLATAAQRVKHAQRELEELMKKRNLVGSLRGEA